MQYCVGPIDNSLISTIFDAPLLPCTYPVTVHIVWCLNLYDDEPAYRISLFHELYTVTGNRDSSVIVVTRGPEIGVRFATCGGWVNIQSSSGAHPISFSVDTGKPSTGVGWGGVVCKEISNCVFLRWPRTVVHCSVSSLHLQSSSKVRYLMSTVQLVEALHYKHEGRGFDSRWCTGIFYWHNPSGRAVALGSTQPVTNENKEYFLGG